MDEGDTSVLRAAVMSSLRCTKWRGEKKYAGGGKYREFRDKHAGTLIITRIR